MAAPPLKWPGGKTKLLPELVRRLPRDYRSRRHVELFAGGAALFFETRPDRAVLNDANADLINFYDVLRHRCFDLIRFVDGLEPLHTASFYKLVRHLYNTCPGFDTVRGEHTLRRAAWFYYLNRTCFNGLYRVNSKGEFNGPIGSKALRQNKIVVLQDAKLYAAEELMRDMSIDLVLLNRDFEAVSCAAGDFVYADPPYVPLPNSPSFTAYTSNGFGEADQRRLANKLHLLSFLGIPWMLSNSDTPLIHDLYSQYTIEMVSAPRRIAANGDRTPAAEVLVRNYA